MEEHRSHQNGTVGERARTKDDHFTINADCDRPVQRLKINWKSKKNYFLLVFISVCGLSVNVLQSAIWIALWTNNGSADRLFAPIGGQLSPNKFINAVQHEHLVNLPNFPDLHVNVILILLEVVTIATSLGFCAVLNGTSTDMSVLLGGYVLEPILGITASMVAKSRWQESSSPAVLSDIAFLYLLYFSLGRFIITFNKLPVMVSSLPELFKVPVVCGIAARLVLTVSLSALWSGVFSFATVEIAGTVAAIYVCAVTNLFQVVNFFLAHRFDYGAHADFLGDTTSGKKSLDKMLRVLDRMDELKDIDVERAIFGKPNEPEAACLVRIMKDLDDNDRLLRLRSMINDNRESVADISVRLESDLKLALRLYTAEEEFRLYVSINSPFQQPDRTKDSTKHSLPMMKILITAIRALALAEGGRFLFQGTVYRGQYLPVGNPMRQKWDSHKVHFAENTVLSFAPLISTSTRRESAERHINDYYKGETSYKLLYVFVGIAGVRIDELSHYSDEQEVLWCPPSLFAITSTEKHDNGWLILFLRPYKFASADAKRRFTYLSPADGVISKVG
jgi:hypothetical protein